MFAAQFRIDLETLADLAHVPPELISHAPESELLQDYMRNAASVISALVEVGDLDIERAVTWFRHAPLIELGGATAEHYVSQGKTASVHGYVLALAAGATG
ncbi:hypothetical protein LJR143_003619 [Pseudoxanthomonas sp. LjRoot143]|uniref:hypothetical protein n=1 Tax=Pseudoxanthomonas sp. LjRoot143 TaxID=3342266 RepID=UPI003ECD7DFA